MSTDVWTIFSWMIIVVLCFFSGLFSGLNLGLMGLDPVGLQIIMASDNTKNRECARKIEPLRRRGNWLLCTLLLGNVAVNAALSILLAEKSSGLVGFFVSTAIITIFGEIVPQALCSRYALEVGSKTTWIVWPLMFMMGIIAYPIAWLLDKLLGDELGTIYSNKELQKLVEIHAQTDGTGVSKTTEKMLKGALGLKDAIVSTCMTEMRDVFWLNDASKLTFDVLTEIFKSGHSRIPIFNTSDKFGRIRCVGILFVKDLILLDPDDEMPVTQIMNAFKHKTPPIVWKDDTLQTALQTFVQTSQHLAFVQDVVKNNGGSSSSGMMMINTNTNTNENELDNTYEYVGILTLEDVIEHVLQTQLIDEHDNFVDNKHLLRTNRLNRIDWTMLHIFDHRQRVLTTLPPQELQAVYHFLSQTIKPFTPKNRLVSEASIKNLLATSSVLRVVVNQDDQFFNKNKFGKKLHSNHSNHSNNNNGDDHNEIATQRDPYKDIEDNGLLLYQRDQKTRYFTLLLDGKCEIYAGRQGFRCELTRWSYLCPDALDHCVECHRYNKPLLDWVPDFTCKVLENSRVLRIKLDDFKACLEGQFDFDTKLPNSPIPPDQSDMNESVFSMKERQRLMTTASEPALLHHDEPLTPGHITDNSNVHLQHDNGQRIERRKTMPNPNPNYRLNFKNNLSYKQLRLEEHIQNNNVHAVIEVDDHKEVQLQIISTGNVPQSKPHATVAGTTGVSSINEIDTLDSTDDDVNDGGNASKYVAKKHIYKNKAPSRRNSGNEKEIKKAIKKMNGTTDNKASDDELHLYKSHGEERDSLLNKTKQNSPEAPTKENSPEPPKLSIQ